MPGYEVMKYNYFWICDSGVRALTLTLRDLVSKMDEKVALVHAVPYTANRKGFSSTVEKVFCRIYLNSIFSFFIICRFILGPSTQGFILVRTY